MLKIERSVPISNCNSLPEFNVVRNPSLAYFLNDRAIRDQVRRCGATPSLRVFRRETATLTTFLRVRFVVDNAPSTRQSLSRHDETRTLVGPMNDIPSDGSSGLS